MPLVFQDAIKFTPEGEPVAVRATHADGWVRFSVSDTGLGIPAEDLPLPAAAGAAVRDP